MRAHKDSWPQIVLANSCAKEGARMVLLCLAHHATDNGVVSVSTVRLTNLSGLCHRQTRRALDSLIQSRELKLLTKGNGRGNPATYQITVKSVFPFHEKRRRKRAKIAIIKGDIAKPPLFSEKGDIITPFYLGEP